MLAGGTDALLIRRSEGYTGILVDDLVTKGAEEPYRMFTSRAEFRLHLRIDNADERLTPILHRCGIVSSERWALYEKKRRQKALVLNWLNEQRVNRSELALAGDDRPVYAVWLRRPEARIEQVAGMVREFLREEPAPGLLTTIETELKYAGYIEQQQRQMRRLRDSEERRIPDALEFGSIPGISREVSEKLSRVRPETLGQAGRIPGVTPAAVAVLAVYLDLHGRGV